jgi:hypothetical protein
MHLDYLIDAVTTFWRWTTHDAVAAYTAVLAISTIGLWIVTMRGIRNQRRDTEILQRAYPVKPFFSTGDAFTLPPDAGQNI